MKLSRAAAAALLLFAGCGKKPPTAAGLDFAAYGDCRHRRAIHQEICRSILAASPKYVIVTGDLVDYAERPEQWAEWKVDTEALRAKLPYICAAGNHDLAEGKLFQKTLGLDRLYFDRREGDVHLFILDSNGSFNDPAQLEWLEKTAFASTALHKVAVFHHPPFMISPKRNDEPVNTAAAAAIHPLLVKLKFCAAVCGHQHAFYTTLRDGIRYVVTAGGGAPLWDLDKGLGLPSDLTRKFFHFVGFKIDGRTIRGHVYEKDGVEDPDLRFTLCQHP
jgi:3',5'-cyclic AMP phosphodiesterase CpdA